MQTASANNSEQSQPQQQTQQQQQQQLEQPLASQPVCFLLYLVLDATLALFTCLPLRLTLLAHDCQPLRLTSHVHQSPTGLVNGGMQVRTADDGAVEVGDRILPRILLFSGVPVVLGLASLPGAAYLNNVCTLLSQHYSHSFALNLMREGSIIDMSTSVNAIDNQDNTRF